MDDFAQACARAARATLAEAAAHEDPGQARILELAAEDLLKPVSPELEQAIRDAAPRTRLRSETEPNQEDR